MTSLFVLNRVKKKIQEEKQQRELCACQESEIRLMHSPENQYEPLPTDLQCILELIIHFLLFCFVNVVDSYNNISTLTHTNSYNT